MSDKILQNKERVYGFVDFLLQGAGGDSYINAKRSL